MEKEEIQRMIADSISAAMGPISEMMGTLSNTMVKMAEQQTAMQQQLPKNEDPEDGLSQSTKDWLKEQRTGGLGGKLLEGDPRFNRGSQESNNNQLTGKEI